MRESGQLRGWLDDADNNPEYDSATRAALLAAIGDGLADFDLALADNGVGSNGSGDDTMIGVMDRDILMGGAGNDNELDNTVTGKIAANDEAWRLSA